MRVYRYLESGRPEVGVLLGGRLVPVSRVASGLAPAAPGDLDEIVQRGRIPALGAAAAAATAPPWGPRLPEVELLAPLVRPPKIWCIGLNYPDHARDLDAATTESPVGFLRPAASIVGPGDPVRLPRGSKRVTGEGELVLVLGRTGRDWTAGEAWGAVCAFTLAVDMTAEDLLRENPRFLTRAKSYDTFLSLGPGLVTPEEVAPASELASVRVATLLEGRAARTNVVGNMTHAPEKLVRFFSEDMTWRAGDILLTGTPGAVPLLPGATVGAEVAGIGRLQNPVEGPRRSAVLENGTVTATS